jgi:hypothetical protein
MKILPLMSEKNIQFLKELYDNSLGQATFDYVGADNNGTKLLVEVKSTYGSNAISSLPKKHDNHI